MYCKFKSPVFFSKHITVLIVAKCIVNVIIVNGEDVTRLVLIVAKCIVNVNPDKITYSMKNVLIVAKCIVNLNGFMVSIKDLLY